MTLMSMRMLMTRIGQPEAVVVMFLKRQWHCKDLVHCHCGSNSQQQGKQRLVQQATAFLSFAACALTPVLSSSNATSEQMNMFLPVY
jgi:hypothetical protein